MRVGKKKVYKGISQHKRVTRRDIERQIYREAGMLDQLKPLRSTPTQIQRILEAEHVDSRLADTMTQQEDLEYIASFSGIKPGRTSGTLPERLVGSWLIRNGFKSGGEGYSYNSGADFGFQIPLLGGKFVDGGTVIDFFIEPRASTGKMGVALFIDGIYAHSHFGIHDRDESAQRNLEAKGYQVERITDQETFSQGVLDSRMKAFMRAH